MNTPHKIFSLRLVDCASKIEGIEKLTTHYNLPVKENIRERGLV